MSTTNLFVELIVIGVGAAIWFSLLVLTFFGYEWIPVERLLSLPATLPMLSIVYLFGVLTDRMADVTFEKLFAHANRVKVYGKDNTRQYYLDRDLILDKSERFSEEYEYSRSRQRIARGWTLNAAAIAIALNLFLWTNLQDRQQTLRISLFFTLFLILLAMASRFSWQRLSETQYKKVMHHAIYLREHPQEQG